MSKLSPKNGVTFCCVVFLFTLCGIVDFESKSANELLGKQSRKILLKHNSNLLVLQEELCSDKYRRR